MDDKTKIELMWEERNENKKLLQDVQKDINEIKLLLASAKGGLRVTTFIGGIAGSVITLVVSWFIEKK
jgi:hypothetical protein